MGTRYTLKHHLKKQDRKALQMYTNIEVAASHIMRSQYLPRFLEHPGRYAPKLLWAAKQIVRNNRKTVALVKQHTGFEFLGQDASLLEVEEKRCVCEDLPLADMFLSRRRGPRTKFGRSYLWNLGNVRPVRTNMLIHFENCTPENISCLHRK